MERRDQTIGVAFTLVAALGFGAIPTLTRLAFDAGLNVPTALAIRFSFAVLLAWPVLLARRRWRVPRRKIPALLLVTLCFVTNTGAFFLAVQHAPVAAVAVIFYTYPVLVTLLSAIFLGERLTPPRVGALVLAMAGCLLTLELNFSGLSSLGVLFAAASGTFYTIYIMLGGRLTRDVPVTVTSTWVMTGSALAYAVFGLASGSLRLDVAPRGWAIMAAMVVVATVLPVQLFLAGVQKLGPSRASILGTLEPVAAVALAAVVLGERVGPYQIAGGVLVVAAVLLLRVPPAEPSVRERPSSV